MKRIEVADDWKSKEIIQKSVIKHCELLKQSFENTDEPFEYNLILQKLRNLRDETTDFCLNLQGESFAQYRDKNFLEALVSKIENNEIRAIVANENGCDALSHQIKCSNIFAFKREIRTIYKQS